MQIRLRSSHRDGCVRALILAGGALALSKKPTSVPTVFLRRHREAASEEGKRFKRVADRNVWALCANPASALECKHNHVQICSPRRLSARTRPR